MTVEPLVEKPADTRASDLPRPALTLAVLTGIFTLNFMDRQLVAVLAEPIKHDLGLSDTALGVLYGFGFALLFGLAGLPLARFADRGRRVALVNASLILFSVMSAGFGLAATFWQLLLTRIGVAVAESGTNPASHSIIADLYPINRRSSAMAWFSLGPHLGVLLAFLIGGLAGQAYGWRAAFIVAGLMGLVFAAASLMVLREPARRGTALAEQASLADVARRIVAIPSTRHLFAAAAVISIASYAVIGWLPSVIIRSAGLSVAQTGVFLAIVLGIAGGVGTVLGGLVADRSSAGRPAQRVVIVAIVLAVAAPLWGLAFLAQQPWLVLASVVLPGAALGVHLGPTFAMVQSLVAPEIRATAAALLLMLANVVGLGIGPLAVGVLSDMLAPRFGIDSLRYAMVLVPPLLLWAAWHYLAAARTIAADLADAEASGGTVVADLQLQAANDAHEGKRGRGV